MLARWCAAIAWATVVAGPTVSAQSAPAPTQEHELEGKVFDDARRPLPLVEIALIRDAVISHTIVSANDGQFSFGAVPAGPITLYFRRLGYAPHMLDLVVGPDGHPKISGVILAGAPSTLAEITISDVSTTERYRGFNERRKQRAAFARFLEQSDIRRLGASNASDLFRTVPGITIRSASPGNTIRIRGCQPMVQIDGQRVPGAELDEVIQPGDIGAIEFYPSSAGIPAQFLERGNRLCGLILVWSR